MPGAREKIRLGIDLGTGSLKLVAFTVRGEYSASHAYGIRAPQAGVAETDPEEWISALRETWRSVRLKLEEAGMDAEIESIGLAGQMHGFVPISAKGETLHDAILWADTRGAEFSEEYARLLAPAFGRLLNAPAAGLTALILLWMKRCLPELYAATAHILFPKDYLRFRLSGDIGTDPGDASASLLYDFTKHSWSEEALKALGLDGAKLPEIRDSFAHAGRVSARAAKETGLPEGTPVAVGSADTSCALYGSGLFSEYFAARASGDSGDWKKPKIAQVSVGTGAQVIIPVRGIPVYDPALNFFESCVDGVGYRMAAMLNGGIALEWVLSALGADWTSFYRDLDAGHATLPDDLLFLPYLTGERSPYRNPGARGAWIGIGLHHKRNDLLAAALLGVACTVRLGLETLGAGGETRVVFVGGSSRYAHWMRIMASVLERPINVSSVSDASARGAAAIGLSSARFGSFDLADIPAENAATSFEAVELPWIGGYYRRFKSCYSALFGESKGYFSD